MNESEYQLDASRRRRWVLLAEEIADLGSKTFTPGFSDRVLRRISESRRLKEESVHWNLRWMFARVAVAGVALAVLLGTYNAIGGTELAGTLVDTLLGLPAPDFESVILLAGA